MRIWVKPTTTRLQILKAIIDRWFSYEPFKHDRHTPNAIPNGAWQLRNCGIPLSVLMDKTKWEKVVMHKIEKSLMVVVKREQRSLAWKRSKKRLQERLQNLPALPDLREVR